MTSKPRGSLARKVYDLLNEEGPLSVKDLVEKLGISNPSSRSILVKLLQAGYVERMNLGVYRIVEDDRRYEKN